MSWLSNWFTTWPKRLPEGYVKHIDFEHLRIVLCGENHAQLEGHDPKRLGGSHLYGPTMWLRVFKKSDGEYTLKLDSKALEIVGYELQRQIRREWPEMADPDEEI